MRRIQTLISCFLIVCLLAGCATPRPYVGVNPDNPQFERGRPCPPVDLIGMLVSLPFQLLFWNYRYGSRRVSVETEEAVAELFRVANIQNTTVRINQWAPHKDIKRLFANQRMSGLSKALAFPGVLFTSAIGRPFGGLLVSDYYNGTTNTIHLFSDDIAIALHEAMHAMHAQGKHFIRGGAQPIPTYGMDLVEEYSASSDVYFYLEQTGQYEELLRAYRILIPAYMTYVGSYLPVYGPLCQAAGVLVGHIIAPFKVADKRKELEAWGKIPVRKEVDKKK